MIIKLHREEIESLIIETQSKHSIPEDDIKEMAIPTYLHKNKLIQWLFWKRHSYIIQMAKLNSVNSVLDFGCGIGVLLPTLCRDVKGTVMATDLFPFFAEKLAHRKKMNVHFCNAHSLDQDIENRSLDLIIAADSMEHLEDPTPYLELFNNKLAENGRLVISGPTENWMYRLGRVVAGYKGADYHHTNIGELEQTISSNGFTVTGKKHLPFAIPPHLFDIIEFTKK